MEDYSFAYYPTHDKEGRACYVGFSDEELVKEPRLSTNSTVRRQYVHKKGVHNCLQPPGSELEK